MPRNSTSSAKPRDKKRSEGHKTRETDHAESGTSPPTIIRPFAPGYFGKDSAKRYEVTLLRRPGEYIVELVNQHGWLKFVIAKVSGIEYADEFAGKYIPDLQAKAHRFFHLPSEPTEPGDLADLAAEIRAFIHRYFDCDAVFESVVVLYVLMTWVYECFSSVPYLRFLGEPGFGKTRAMRVISACCYRPTFFEGATTAATIFRWLDVIGGTLAIDEADFSDNGIGSDIAKILNSSYGQGGAVPRMGEGRKGQRMKLESFDCFGPKILGGRKPFNDDATESRCLTHYPILTRTKGADAIPTQVDPRQIVNEARTIQNKALGWRLRNLDSFKVRNIEAPGIGRSKELIQPLMLIAEAIGGDAGARYRDDLLTYAHEREADLVDRDSLEAQLVAAFVEAGEPPTVGDLAAVVRLKNPDDKFLRSLQPRKAGATLKILGFDRTREPRGYSVSIEPIRLKALKVRYGL